MRQRGKRYIIDVDSESMARMGNRKREYADSLVYLFLFFITPIICKMNSARKRDCSVYPRPVWE